MIPLLALVMPLALWPLDQDDGGFVPGGSPGEWEWGVPQVGPVTPDTVWGTNLDGFALNDAVDLLEIPLPDLSSATTPVLLLRHWYRLGTGDRGVLEVDDGNGWQTLTPAYGYPQPEGFAGDSGGWVEDAFPLPGPGARSVRLRFESDASLSAEGWYLAFAGVFDGDVAAPRILSVSAPEDTEDLDGPYPFVVEAIDDQALSEVRLVWRLGAGPDQVLVLDGDPSDTFSGALSDIPPGATVSWHVEADDGEQVTRWPETEEGTFRVFLAPPTDLRGPEGRVVGLRVPLAWDPPQSAFPVVGFEVSEAGGDRVETVLPFASVHVSESRAHTWTVRGLYDIDGDTIAGDPSEPLVLDVEVPGLDALYPAAGRATETLWVTVEGHSLYLSQPVAEASFGDGITVEEMQVLDADRAMLRVHVEEGAEAGLRDLRLTGAQGAFRFDDVFEVLSEPGTSVVQVSPGTLYQGRPTFLEVSVQEPFAGPVTVDPGEDLLLLSEPTLVEDTVVRFEVLAPLDAAPGPRTLVLDDGERILGVPVVVRETFTQVGGCESVPAAPSLGWLAGLLVLVRRRRSASR